MEDYIKETEFLPVTLKWVNYIPRLKLNRVNSNNQQWM